MYAAAVDNWDKIVIHANDTDVVVLLLYLVPSLHQIGLKEIWMNVSVDSCWPIPILANRLDDQLSKVLPFINSSGERDTASYTYFQGKQKWFCHTIKANISALTN